MVGHFLHPNRKNRTNNNSNNSLSATSASNNSSDSQDTNTGADISSSNDGASNAMHPATNRYAPASFDMPFMPPQNLTAEAVAALPPPGLSGPSSFEFSPHPHSHEPSRYLVYVSLSPKSSSSTSRRMRSPVEPALAAAVSATERQLSVLDLQTFQLKPLLHLPAKRRFDSETSTHSSSDGGLSLEERLRRERQRLHSSGGLTQFGWTHSQTTNTLRLLVPIRGNLYAQDGLDATLRMVYDKHSLQSLLLSSKLKLPSSPPTSAIDPQLSPDGKLFAFCAVGEIFVAPCHQCLPPTQITFGADLKSSITHGLADFVAQEEMDRYRGYWWTPDSQGIIFTRVDESHVPPYRVTHHESENTNESGMFEDHRYPFAGKSNPSVRLAYVPVHSESILSQQQTSSSSMNASSSVTTTALNDTVPQVDPLTASPSGDHMEQSSDTENPNPAAMAQFNWNHRLRWFNPPREAQEYLARLNFLPDGSACVQWQNRTQTCLVLSRADPKTGKTSTLLVERSDMWINLNHLFYVLERPIHPKECQKSSVQPPLPDPLPPGSCSFLLGSERSGFCHLYLYTYVPGYNGEQAILIRQVSGGDWMVESVAGVSLSQNVVYVTGTYDSVLERHLYALPILLPEEESDTSSSAMDTDNNMYPSSSGQAAQGNGVRRGFKQVMSALSGKSHSSGSLGSTGSQVIPIVINPLTQSSGSGKRSLEETPDCFATSPIRLTSEPGMHTIVMDPACSRFIDTSSDLGRPTTVRLFELPAGGPIPRVLYNGGQKQQINSAMLQMEEGNKRRSPARVFELRPTYSIYDALQDDKSIDVQDAMTHLPAPELMTFPSSDGTETLHAALYRPDPRVHGPGPYPLICAVYGGPHVQRVNRSWSQCADMRAQRLRSLGFCVVKCDNRGSSRRGRNFESAISRRLGRLEVLDQVAVVRQLTVRGIADPTRVGIYGWSYGGYLSAMCLCRAPDVFHVAVAGAPVTSWDGYDTHYTERYMGLPAENPNGYRESAVFDHVPNMRGKLLLVHGLIDENVHFRHTARLINRLVAAGKDYDLLLFPDERHSPRRLRDRIYMEQRISDYFLKNLAASPLGGAMRTMAGL
eukprot:Nitzschia sp. Nitz4//scaffold111_size72815//43820//47217//NITZ4_005793-RA/size72815-snap-gene-0.109-mRNA-1//-1//CDS//3329533189//1325//frame0